MAAVNQSYVSKFVWMLEAAVFDAISGLARVFAIDSVSDFGGSLFRALGPLTRANRVAERNPASAAGLLGRPTT